MAPLTGRDFEILFPSACVGRWDVISSGTVSNPAMQAF